MVYSDYVKLRILFCYRKGHKAPTIYKRLGLECTRESIHRFLKRYEIYRSIHRKPGSGRLSSITAVIKALVEQQMQTDDETTAYQLLLATKLVFVLFCAVERLLGGHFEAAHIAS